MGDIRKIKGDVHRALKSQTLLLSPASAVRELVQNSVDSGASEVRIVVDLFKLKTAVYDNGNGISPNNMNRIGVQHATSKIRALEDLRSLDTYGYRGEALCSLASVSKITIASKVKDYNSTWVRKFPDAAHIWNSSDQERGEDVNFRMRNFGIHESGTIALIEDLLYNVPVRKKYYTNSPHFKMHMAIKKDLFQILVLHPHIEVVLDIVDENGRKRNLITSGIIAAEKTTFQKITFAFLHIFGAVVPLESFKRVAITFKEFQIDGVISKNAVRSRGFQFIYINGRRHKDPVFTKYVDNMFQVAGFGYNDLNESVVKSIRKPYDNHPLFVIHVRCPNDMDDLMQDSDKNIFKFSRSQIVHPLITKMIQSFLKYQGYTSAANTKYVSNQKVELSKTAKNTFSFKASILDSKICKSIISETVTSGRLKGSSCVPKPSTRPIFREDIPNCMKKRRTMPEQVVKPKISSDSLFDVQKLYDECFECDATRVQNCIRINLERSQLANSEIINQVGKKFVLLRIPRTEHNLHSMLVIVDQHASDERIKLESYLKKFVLQALNGTLVRERVHDCNILLDGTELDLFKHFASELNKWGISYNIDEYGTNMSSISINCLPDVLVRKFDGDKIFLKKTLLQTAMDLQQSKRLPLSRIQAKECFEDLEENFEWWKYLNSVPTVFREIFNSKACRSAIMFGNELSRVECTLLVKDLAKCKFPFQCAHGRPSVIPITEIRSIDGDDSNESNKMKCGFLDYDVDIS